MATITANTGSNNWNTNGAWVGGVQPTAADDVVIPASAVVTIPASTTVYGRSLDVASGATLAIAATTSYLNLGDGTAGAGNRALRIDAGSTITLTGVGAIQLVSTSATQQTVATGGKTLPNIAFGAVAGSPSYLLSDALTCSGTVTLTYGTLNTNGQTCNWYRFSSSNSNTRVFTTGASTITVTGSGANVWWMPTATNMTVNASGSTINLSGGSVQFYAGFAWWDVNFTGGGAPFTGSPNTSFRNLTVTGTAVKTDYFGISAYNITVSGTLTLSGNSATNRLLVQSLTGGLVPDLGNARTITAAAVSLSNVDFMDIAGAGAAAPFTGTSIGDCGGLSGITFDAPTTQTHTASAGGNWSDPTKWTSRVPLPQDNVVVDASTTGTLTCDMPRMGKDLTFTGFAGTLSIGLVTTQYGSLTLSTGMTVSAVSAWVFSGRGSHTITSAGKSFGTSQNIITAPGGTYTLQDAYVGSSYLSLTHGSLDTNSQSVNVTQFISTGSATRSVTCGTTAWTLTTTGASYSAWNVTASGMTMSAASSSMTVSAATTNDRYFAGAGFSYSSLTYTVANSPGKLLLTGANTITTLNVGSGRQLVMPSATTTTVTNWNVNGTVNGYCYLPGNGTSNLSTPDSAAVSITGDLDIRVRVALDKWSGMANNATLVDKVDYAANSSYQFAVLNDGSMFAYVSHTGAGLPESATSTANLSATADGATLWVRMTYRASDGRVQFFKASGSLTAAVAADFTQVGADRFTATSGAIFDGNRAVGIGDGVGGTPYPAKGKFYRVQLRNGLDGTLAFDADLTTVAPGVSTFTESANAATVTLNGMAQQGMGCVCINSSTGGTAATVSKASGAVLSDYVTVQDIAATGGATWNAGAFGRSVSGNSGWAFNTVTANLGVTGNWNANGTWYGGVQPTAANNVAIPPTATVTIPAATTALGRSLSEYGTLIFASDTTSVLTLGDATAGAGNRAFYAPKNVETNLAPNPNAELDAANWASWYLGHASAVTRSTTQAYSGSASIRMVPDGTTPYLGADCGFTGVVGKRYSVSCAFRAPTTGSFTMDLRDWPSVWSYVADQGYVSMQAGEWRVFTWTNISPAAATSAWVVNTQGNFTASVPVYLDNLMIAESATPVPYFDGSTTATVDYTYAWTGAANASTSTRTLNRSSNITLTGMGVINFVSTSATQQTITTGTKQLPSYSITGVGSSYLLTDANTAVGQVTLLNGTLDTGSQVCVWGWFTSNVGNVRTLTMGASRITVTISGNAWYSTGINLTVTANTAVITMSGTNLNPNPVDYTQFVEGSTCNYNGASIVMAGIGQFMTCGNITVANLTRTGGAVKTDVLSLNGGSLTVTGTLTVNGNSATNRMMVRSNSGAVAALGTPITVTAAAVAASNVDWQDIVAAGAANWNLSAIAGGAGDCGGNAGITFTASATQTHTASAGGSWSDVSKWTSRVPLPQDDVVVNASTTGTLTADMPRMGKSINFTGFAGVCTLGSDVTSYGSLTLASGMTVGGVFAWTFAGRSACSLTSAGKVFPQNLFVSAPGGTVTLQDALSGGYVVLLAGTFNTNNQGVTCTGLADNNSTAARTWTFGTSTVTLTGVAGANMMYATSSGCTMNAASATFVVSVASASTRAFVGAGFSYGTLRYTVASSPGSLTITGANTFGTLDIGPGRPLILPSSTTTTVTNMNAAGVPNGYTYLPGVTGNYLSTPDSAALSITGDIDIRVRVAMDDWTPAASMVLAAKWPNSFAFRVNTAGTLSLFLSTDGAAWPSATSSVATGSGGGTTAWVRATWRASDGRVQFFTASGALTSPTAGDFTQLGTDQTVAIASLYDGTNAVEIGSFSSGTAQFAAGKFYRAQIRNGLDGTLVFDADLTTKTCGARSFTESALGATVTINGASAQAGDGSINLSASTPGTFATLHHAGVDEIYGLDYLSISDIHATV